MKIEIKQTVQVKKEIDIEFPYYYKISYADNDEVEIFGKIVNDMLKLEIVIEDSIAYSECSLFKERYWTVGACKFLEEEYKSTEEEFNTARERAFRILEAL